MKYGAMNLPLNPVLNEIALFSDMGFDYLELTMDAPLGHYAVIRKQKKDLLRALADHNMGLVCHLPTFVYTADFTESIRQTSLEEMLASVETAAELEPSRTVLHPGMISGLGIIAKDTARKYALESLHTVVRKAGEVGLFLCLENMPPVAGAFTEPEEMAQLLEIFPSQGMTLDVGHAHIKEEGKNRIKEFFRLAGKRIRHIHVSDNKGKRDDHLPVGKGSIDFSEIIRELKKIGYAETVTLEIFTEDRRELIRSRERFADLLAGE
ncbi:MAG: sugar phosphate isomerase/epimerase family protein [Desulfobacterales bacterium]